MAETETNVSTVDTQSTQQQSNEPAKAQENNTPTVEELMAQLAAERAEKEKYKSASDKASSEAAKYKKELRSKQTAEEQEAEAKAEADKLRDEELESLRKELNHNKVSLKPFKVVSMTSWLAYGGYAARAMLPPSSYVPQEILLRGNRKEIKVIM